MFNPMHPGQYLLRVYLEPLKLSAKEMAKNLDVSASTLSRIINEKQDIDAEMAVKLSKVTGRSAESWLNLQRSYSLPRAIEKIDVSKLKPLDVSKWNEL